MAAADLITLKDETKAAIRAGNYPLARQRLAEFMMEYQATPNIERESLSITWRQINDLEKLLDKLETQPTQGRGVIATKRINRVNTRCGSDCECAY